MNLDVTDELRELCRKIANEQKSDTDWAAAESDDAFQTKHYVGGYDATERAFCFSYYDASGTEYWFQITLEDVGEILNGTFDRIDGRLANSGKP